MTHDSIEHLQQIIIDGGGRLFEAGPLALKNIIDDRAWESRQDKDGKVFKSFEAFIQHRFWQGLESTIDDLRIMCRKHPEVRKAIDIEVGALPAHGEVGRGRSDRHNNIMSIQGTNPTYTLKRLKRDRPDLAEKVINGELTANAAAIEAGFRKVPSPYNQIVKLIPKLSVSERDELRRML